MTLKVATSDVSTCSVEEVVTTFMNGSPCLGIDPFDRAFLYGDGFFTSILVRDGTPLLWNHHLDRLTQGVRRLTLNAEMAWVETEVMQKARILINGILKVIISRGIGARGYLAPDQASTIYIQLFPESGALTSHEKQPIKSGLLQGHLGQTIPQLAGLKTLNRLEQVILRRELANCGWVEALVCDAQGQIVEGVYSNCFFRIEGQWMTPPISLSGIQGVMRAELIARMEERKFPLRIESLHRDSLFKIEALFFCNALTGMVPVSHLQDRLLDFEAVKSLSNLLF
ncbi:aminodeoxychorismate lyase [Aquirhabdus parva]|uniref:Aminodeoxychorismate lyase n=1 Tax=Aquirhabdus parva TaxID=2283318 RepID=A0A345P6U7_9GAMM|nr:aminodeoxychorismate lyase [Aquirhabdus parva]AXI03006.1 aminodeoxychorismate lyase [Aquirhabdus parva]